MTVEKELLKRALDCLDILHYYIDKCGIQEQYEIESTMKEIEEYINTPIAWLHEDGKRVVTHNNKLYGSVGKGYNIPLYKNQK
jgi:hypothetical protein